ncbi:MAG: magnetochrome domain-containing protein [Candidatus Omnitrophica bacterium]|nr:magnetochrome domain-containing protein [Candidatus Omnitrophota bacterium]
MIDAELSQYRNKRWKRNILLTLLIVVGLLIVAALMHIGAGDAEWGGMTVSNPTSALQMEFAIPKDETGVVVDWCEDPAYTAGVRSGDLIKGINNRKVANLADFLKVTKVTSLEQGVLLDILRNGQPLFITMEHMVGLHDKLKKALNIDPGTTGVVSSPVAAGPTAMAQAVTAPDAGQPLSPVAFAPAGAMGNRAPAETAEAAAMNPANAPAVPSVVLPSPKEQGAAQKELIEGHWLGMELIPLTPELATEYKIPPHQKGLLVDEISLESAESGILAGDMVVAVENYATPDLVAFTEATRRVKNRRKADVQVSRRGQLMEFTFVSTRTIGFSQNEAAQPITPGALSPHRNRSKPCTACHIIMITGGQLPTDAGDILPNPPPITKGAVAPHEYRGKCKNCHLILKPAI